MLAFYSIFVRYLLYSNLKAPFAGWKKGRVVIKIFFKRGEGGKLSK